MHKIVGVCWCRLGVLTCSWGLLLAFNALPPATSTTSCGNGDSDGDGCRRGLAEIDGDGLGVRNGPGGDNIPVEERREERRGDKRN